MTKIKNLNRYQKCILLLMIIIILIFTVIYPITISQIGFEYKGVLLVASQENGSIVYSGKIQGQTAQFTVSKDKTVVFGYGNKTYGPYTAIEDSTAIPKDEEMAEHMTGIELRQGEEILFRGGVLETEESCLLYNENGTLDNWEVSYITSDGIERDENGNVIDSMAPSPSTILNLMNGPELTHKGEWLAWFGAVFICLLNTISILFADELFRWNLTFQIRNADQAEPSDWKIADRHITWTILTLTALIFFIIGLQ